MIRFAPIMLGMKVNWGDWLPMSYGSYADLVHAWRTIEPEWNLYLAVASFELADQAGVVFC